MKWYPYELHTHTLHSDGVHTLMEMAIEARKLGIDGLALTDHNTISGLADQDVVTEETGLHIVRGLEWTTFYGHMLTLGIDKYEDWRILSPIDIQKGMKRLHEQGALVGIAHPFDIGTPICTGCYWEYEITDWDLVDYIEVWNGTLPSITHSNKRAFELWTEKLNEGLQIPATSGRDWHHTSPNDGPPAVTFLQMKDQENCIVEADVLQAVKEGKMSISLGPLLLLTGQVNSSGQSIGLGDKVELDEGNKQVTFNIELDCSARKGKWELLDQTLKVLINSNKGVLQEFDIKNQSMTESFDLNMEGVFWIRAEIYGVISDVRTLIGFTNPIYFNE